MGILRREKISGSSDKSNLILLSSVHSIKETKRENQVAIDYSTVLGGGKNVH